MFGFGITIIVLGVAAIITAICLIMAAKNRGARYRLWGIVCLALAVVFITGGGVMTRVGMGSESFKRWQKNLESNYSGGLEREITLIDKDGNVLRHYEGKIDIEETDGTKVVFLLDGRKIIIYNTSIFNTIIVEEKESAK